MDDELSEGQVAELSEALHSLVQELRDQLETTEAGAEPVDLDEPIGRLSRMDAMQQQQMNRAHRRRAEVRLQQARAALSAVERGDYGLCNLCEEPIGYARLKVKPESPICIACQSERESRG